MTPSTVRDWIFALIAFAVLCAFVWLFGGPLWNALFSKVVHANLLDEISDPKTYVATAVAALVGGVSTVFLGIKSGQGGITKGVWNLPDLIRVLYVVVYVVLGAAAVVAWTKLVGSTPVLIRNLAVTFIGLVTPAVATYLGAPASPPHPTRTTD